jgi:hypothetical protein
MSTIQVANLHLESTGNNRIQYSGSNTFSIVAGGTNYCTVNSTNMSVNGSIVSANLFVSAKTDNYTLAANDSGSVITISNTALKTVTVPASLPVGFRCMVYMLNTGNVVIGNATGVTLSSRTNSYTCSTRYGSMSVFVYTANNVIVDGAIG